MLDNENNAILGSFVACKSILNKAWCFTYYRSGINRHIRWREMFTALIRTHTRTRTRTRTHTHTHTKGGSRGAQGARAPHLASLIIYSFLNNFVIHVFTTLVHLREALSYYIGLHLKLSFRSIQVYTAVIYPVFSNANNHELFSCAPFSEILDPPVIHTYIHTYFNIHTYIHTYIHMHTQIDRQTDRPLDRQTDRPLDIQTARR